MTPQKKIKIYKDHGEKKSLPNLINELSEWKTSYISSQEIRQTQWETNTSLLIIPGGRDVPFHQALKGEGNDKIKKYVENGGSFLGICAGAYYGCGTVEFDLGTELEVIGSRELAFFPGVAYGPAYGSGTFHYNSELGARASLISNHGNQEAFKSYHNGGCYFTEAERYSNIQILSKYLDIEGQPAAIIGMSIGKGKVILSGVHIEMGIPHFNMTKNSKMSQALERYETQRKEFFKQLLLHLLPISPFF